MISGVGPALATALVAGVADPQVFRSARQFATWVGLVPKQRSSGGKEKLHQQARRSLPERSVYGRGARGHQIRQDPWHRTPSMALSVAGPATSQGCRRRLGEQDRQNGLGHDGQGRAIQGACPVGGMIGLRRRPGVMWRSGGRTARNAVPVDPAIRTERPSLEPSAGRKLVVQAGMSLEVVRDQRNTLGRQIGRGRHEASAICAQSPGHHAVPMALP
jgi:Transposase IS116/IS110/IS902 family